MWEDVTEIKIVLGRDGIFGLRNRDRIPLGGLVQLRNATLEDNTLRTGPGAALFGSAITGTPRLLRIIDYWADAATQRTVVMASDGALYEDNGAGGGWTDITGIGALTINGAVPHFSEGGQETTGLARAIFYADGLNAERVRRSTGAFAALSSPAPEWTGQNRPRGFLINQGYNWAFGNPSLPHHLIRSLDTNHENFTSTRFAPGIFTGDRGLYVSCAISFKGFIILWKFPEGVYAYDTRHADPAQWYAIRIGSGGAPGPGSAVVAENDVVWIDPVGGWHMLSATQEAGSMRAEDISYRKLNRFLPDQVSRAMLPRAQLEYVSDRQKLVLACAAQGSTRLNRRIVLDLNNKNEVGERWVVEDRDTNESIFLRRGADNVQRLMMGDDVGQVWSLDQDTRTKNGAGYTFEWWMADTDFSQVSKGLAGKINNGAYLAVGFDPRSAGSHTVRVWRDGRQRQSISFDLTGGTNTLPFTLPITFGAETMMQTRKRRLLGSARRWAFQGISSVSGQDVSLAGLLLGLTPGRE